MNLSNLTPPVRQKATKPLGNVSTCREANVTVNTSDEGTAYYVCDKCGNPCDTLPIIWGYPLGKFKGSKKRWLKECICNDYDGQGKSTCGFDCPVHSGGKQKINLNKFATVGYKDFKGIRTDKIKLTKPSAGKAEWEKEWDNRFGYMIYMSTTSLGYPTLMDGSGEWYSDKIKNFIRQTLASELTREKENIIKEFLLLGNRYINKRFKTDNFIILGSRLDRFTQAARKVRGK